MNKPTPEAEALRTTWLKAKQALSWNMAEKLDMPEIEDVLERMFLEIVEKAEAFLESAVDRQTYIYTLSGVWQHPNFTGIEFELIGQPSDPRDLLGQATKALKAGGREDLAEQFFREALMGDADHLIRMCLEYFDVPSPRD